MTPRQSRCVLDCPWHDTDMCVQCLLSYQHLHENRLGLGVLHGLRLAYYPQELPPCIRATGMVDWRTPIGVAAVSSQSLARASQVIAGSSKPVPSVIGEHKEQQDITAPDKVSWHDGT